MEGETTLGGNHLLLTIGFILMLTIPLWRALARDFEKGLAYAVFLCVSMSTFLRVPLPGNLPQLTIFRIVLILLTIFWFRTRESKIRITETPFFRPLTFWMGASFVSLLFTSIDFVTSLKRFLDFVLEVWMFYIIVATSIKDEQGAVRLLRAAWKGLVLVAVLAVWERYTGFNPILWITGESGGRDVVSTYQHRILLGTAMAMAFPIAFALMHLPAQDRSTRKLWISILLFLSVCYFGQSRGPWLATLTVATVLLLLAGWGLRRRIAAIFFLGVMVLILRPGITETVSHKTDSTFDSESFKGGTFLYRLELWKIAWNEVTQSPLRTLVGYGPGCGTEMNIEWNLSYRNKEYEIQSWDNHFAYDLFQSGFLGLFASIVLYGSVLRLLYLNWRCGAAEEKELLLSLFAGTVAFVFMMTNVLIFVKQLNFLFWTLAAVGGVMAKVSIFHAAKDPDPLEFAFAGTIQEQP